MKELEYPFDSEFILKKQKSIKRQLLQDAAEEHFPTKKIAILGGSTTNRIAQILEVFLLNFGIKPEFYESDYNHYWEEAVLPNDKLDEFAPDIVYIHTTMRNIRYWPNMQSTKQEAEESIEKEYQHYLKMWESLKGRYHCVIIQNNFEYPPYRLLGNMDSSDYRGKVNFIMALNMKWSAYAQQTEDFFIHDINYLAADYGLSKWMDASVWYMYKYACAVEAIPQFAYSLSLIIKSICGKNKKALVLDLDNTLWGGIIGDDGVDNIELGPETSIGQAYVDVQQYIKELSQTGVVLAVNSKNDYENAVAGIAHPNSCLKLEDFASVQANWKTKSENMKQIVTELNLLPESFVFLDDNPAEREIVQEAYPQISVPALTDVEQYIHIVDRSGFFEATNISEEDIKRAKMYRDNSMRSRMEMEYVNYEDFLKALEMKAEIEVFKPIYFSRITQLINKTNQFNFTTRRYEFGEIKELAEKENYITLCGRLSDKYGDNGIVSVIIGRKEAEVLHIELWIMSCRVFKRNMEFAMMDALVIQCKRCGIKTIKGYYYPTAKNINLKMQYEILGFKKIDEDAEGNTIWRFDIPQNYLLQNKVIEVR